MGSKESRCLKENGSDQGSARVIVRAVLEKTIADMIYRFRWLIQLPPSAGGLSPGFYSI